MIGRIYLPGNKMPRIPLRFFRDKWNSADGFFQRAVLSSLDIIATSLFSFQSVFLYMLRGSIYDPESDKPSWFCWILGKKCLLAWNLANHPNHQSNHTQHLFSDPLSIMGLTPLNPILLLCNLKYPKIRFRGKMSEGNRQKMYGSELQ